MYDIIVVGGGPAGVTAARRIMHALGANTPAQWRNLSKRVTVEWERRSSE